MLSNLLFFMELFFVGIFMLGILGAIVEGLSRCTWVRKATERMMGDEGL